LIKAVAFESKENKGHYTADGPEVALTEGDEYGEVKDLKYALVYVRKDLKTPTASDINNFYEFMKSLNLFDYEEFKHLYKPAEVELTNEQYHEQRVRNDW